MTKQANQEMNDMWGDSASGEGAKGDTTWFVHDRYSMFIHFGLYSLLGGRWEGKTYYGIGEWIMHPSMAGIPVETYKTIADSFNPAAFDAGAIVRLAKKAGMRCIVITAKHHEGFALFDSKASDFTITKATPCGRDLLAELSAACQEEGIRLGFYYSQFQDWVEPDGGGSKCDHPDGFEPEFDRYFDSKVIPQVTELLSSYGPISVVWFDTPGNMGPAYSQRLVDLVHELQPGCLVNSRVGNRLGDYSTLGDMEIPTRTPESGVFECIDTTNDSWAYAGYDSHWKSPGTIVRNLVRVIARGCNYMLNLGPAGDGAIPDPAQEALSQSGDWIARYEEAVYGTGASPFPPFAWGDCTTRENRLYLHVFDWPRSGQLSLGCLAGTVTKAELLPDYTQLACRQENGILNLDLPRKAPDPIASVICLTLESAPAALNQDLLVDGEHDTNLHAEYAVREGVELKQRHWMETFGEWKKTEDLSQWFETADSSATWNLNVLAPGRYSVRVEYACEPESEGSEWVVSTGQETMQFCALPTGQGRCGKRMRYRTAERGLIYFAEPGRTTLTLSPHKESKPGDICVKGIILRPWR